MPLTASTLDEVDDGGQGEHSKVSSSNDSNLLEGYNIELVSC
jgi:hypothetical protein